MEQRHPTSRNLEQKGGKGKNDKNANKTTRPEKKDIYQSESRTGMAILGNLCSRLQDGDTRRSI